VLDDAEGKEAVKALVKQWQGLDKLQARYEGYRAALPSEPSSLILQVSSLNQAQHQLRAAFDPFFEGLHQGLKQLDKIVRQHEKQQAEAAKAEGKRGSTDRKTKALKTALEELHAEVKHAEKFYQDIHWLQERFPEAQYEDVTGLCKLASPAEVAEQDYSLNPGRYVGVVIEEDGKTEAEFLEEVTSIQGELEALNHTSDDLRNMIARNLKRLVS